MLSQANNIMPPKRIIPSEKAGFNPLHSLLAEGDLQSVKKFIKQFPATINGDWKSGGGTPLHIALANENTSLAVETLKEIFAIEKQQKERILDLSIVDLEGKSLLTIAAKTRQWVFVKELLSQAGERVQAIINLKDQSGKTALHYAALYGEVEVARLLVGAGADVKSIDKQELNEQAIRSTLWSIEIHPDRSISATWNGILAPQVDQYARVRMDDKTVLQAKAAAEKHKKERNDGLPLFIVESVEKMLCKPNNYILATKDNLEMLCGYASLFWSETDEKPLKKQSLDRKSIVQHCLEGQELVLSWLASFEEKSESSVSKSENTSLKDQKNSVFHSLSKKLFDYSKAKQEIKLEAYTKLVKQAVAEKVIDAKTAVSQETSLYAALRTEHYDRAKVLMENGSNPHLETTEGDSAAKLIERLLLDNPSSIVVEIGNLLKKPESQCTLRLED